MNKLIDKLIVFIFCIAIYVPKATHNYIVVPILIVVFLSSLLSYLDRDDISFYVFLVYLLFCLFNPVFLYFIPLMGYGILLCKYKWGLFLTIIPLINTNAISPNSISLIIIFLVVTYLIKKRTTAYETLKTDYYNLEHASKDISMQLEITNKSLIEKQDYEIKLATLNERNRIARDIHDNVGHMLSRSILQIGALLSINKDEATKENLNLIKNNLSEAMDSIRNSVHDLHEESVDLQNEIETLIKNFDFCPIEFEYDIEFSLEKNLKYCFLSIIKEALSNIMNHSNATKASILMREHPGFYQLIIEDNGFCSNYNSQNGIGLKNINDRVTSFNGYVNINCDKGFKLFISIPKL